jgi:hypothetical protein
MDCLQHRTGAPVFGVLAGGHVNDTISPTLLVDPANFKFLQEVYKIDPMVFLMKYNSWTNLGSQGITAAAAISSDTMPADLTARRSEVAKMIKSDLRVFLIPAF